MIKEFDLNAFFAVLLGAGGLASLKAAKDVLMYFRAGKAMKEQSLVASLSTALERSDGEVEELKDSLAHRTDERDYWRNLCGKREFQLSQNGIEFEPSKPNIAKRKNRDVPN